MGIFDMLSRMLKGDHTPIFSFLLIFSDLCPILTGFWQIEKWMWHVFMRQDGRVVGAGCLELEVKDTSCSGWEVGRKLMV